MYGIGRVQMMTSELGRCSQLGLGFTVGLTQCSIAKNVYYCSISFNSAPSVTRYQPAEILISAGPRFDRDIQLFSAGKVNFVLEFEPAQFVPMVCTSIDRQWKH